MTIELTIAHHPGGKGPINLLGLFGFWVLFQYGFGRILPCSPGHSANKTAADVARSEVEELQPRPMTNAHIRTWRRAGADARARRRTTPPGRTTA